MVIVLTYVCFLFPIKVKVVNENRYPPEFDFPVYNVSVEENTSGLGLVTVRATDNREVPHQLVTYLLGNVPSLGLYAGMTCFTIQILMTSPRLLQLE